MAELEGSIQSKGRDLRFTVAQAKDTTLHVRAVPNNERVLKIIGEASLQYPIKNNPEEVLFSLPDVSAYGPVQWAITFSLMSGESVGADFATYNYQTS